jgi:YqxM protein
MVAIVYLLFYLAFQLTAPTSAYFNDLEQVRGSLSAADDFGGDDEEEKWDKSSLEKVEGGNSYGGDCTEMFATIKNGGDRNMEGQVDYEVYWSETSNQPFKDGEVVFTGQVPALERGETFEMTYKPDEGNGYYMFKSYQRPGHPGKSSERGLKSETIEVTDCPVRSEVQINENDTEETEDNEPEQKTNTIKNNEPTKQSGTKEDDKTDKESDKNKAGEEAKNGDGTTTKKTSGKKDDDESKSPDQSQDNSDGEVTNKPEMDVENNNTESNQEENELKQPIEGDASL